MLRVEHLGSTALWTIDRPEAKNALNETTLLALADAAEEVSRDTRIAAVIVAGSGGVFAAGGDLRELRGRSSAEDGERLSDLGYHLCHALGELPVPVVAALTGPAIGGGAELALACDMRIADPRAFLQLKQARLGVTTAWGTVPRLVATAGLGAAARLLLTGHAVTAEEALRLGLVDAVTEQDAAVSTALGWCADIALSAPKAISDMKRLIRAASRAAPELRALERQAFVERWAHADHVDAVEAFFERRPARFSSR